MRDDKRKLSKEEKKSNKIKGKMKVEGGKRWLLDAKEEDEIKRDFGGRE